MSFPAITMRQIGAEPIQSVNGRDLHSFLEVGKVFGAWITERIDQFSFQAGIDFEVYSESGNNPSGGRPAKEYALSIDMAKELAMVERTPKGRQVRLYFIECEKRAKAAAITALPDFKNPAVAARAWADQCEGRALAEQRLLEIEPKAAALDRLADTDGLVTISNGAKDLQVEIKWLFGWLMSNRWIFRRQGSKRYIGFSDKLRDGYLKHKFDDVPMPDGSVVQKERVFLTRKGIARLAVILGREVKP